MESFVSKNNTIFLCTQYATTRFQVTSFVPLVVKLDDVLRGVEGRGGRKDVDLIYLQVVLRSSSLLPSSSSKPI